MREDIELKLVALYRDGNDTDDLNAIMAEIAALENIRDCVIAQARIWKAEAVGANNTINKIYQVVSGSTGEPGNWNAEIPVAKRIAALEQDNDWLETQRSKMRETNKSYRWQLCKLERENAVLERMVGMIFDSDIEMCREDYRQRAEQELAEEAQDDSN